MQDEVQRAFAPRPRTCPRCGVTSETSAALCPECRTPYAVRRPRSLRRPLAILGVAVVALGVPAALIVPGLVDDAHRERAADRARQQRLEATERERLRVEARPRTAAGPRARRSESTAAYRGRLVAAGQRAVRADAERRIAAGAMDGPLMGVQCTPYPKTETRTALEADPEVPRGRYECLAYKTRFELPELQGEQRTGILGVPFWLVADYRSGALVFCKVTPKAGEGGRSLASVPVPSVCRDPLPG